MTSRIKTLALPPNKTGEWLPAGASVRVCGWGNIRVSHVTACDSQVASQDNLNYLQCLN